MTKQYKVGDNVLVFGEILEIQDSKGIARIAYDNMVSSWVQIRNFRPYTPRQEFEYGEEVEIIGQESWNRGLFIGRSHANEKLYIINLLKNGSIGGVILAPLIRKLTAKKETITIGGVDYYKDDVEKALKDLKPIGEVK